MKQIIYITSPESQQVHVQNLNHGGALTLTQVVDVSEQVQLMVASPDKRYLYAGVRPRLHILAYRIASDDDALAFAAESALSGNSTHISIDHLRQFVFIGSYNVGNVSVTRPEDGLPVGVVDMIEGLDGCHSANISPDNHTLWVPALKQDCICLFAVNDDGHLVVQGPAEVTIVEGAGPRHMIFHPNERYAYCVNELNSSVNVWELGDPRGNIEYVQTLDMMPENFSDTRWAADIHVIPDGRYLYACDRIASLITVFSAPEDSNVLGKGGSQSTETQPRGFNVDHSGKYLIAVGRKSHHISVCETVDEQGLLREKGRYAVGQGSMWVVVNAH